MLVTLLQKALGLTQRLLHGAPRVESGCVPAGTVQRPVARLRKCTYTSIFDVSSTPKEKNANVSAH